MFFTRVGTVVAWLAFIGGVAQFAVGMAIAVLTPDSEGNALLSERYFNEPMSGAVINEAIPLILGGVALGILCEVSRHVARRG